jgi:hypothetical protein
MMPTIAIQWPANTRMRAPGDTARYFIGAIIRV